MTHNNLKIALIIGSGSIKSAAALGLYRVLQRENIQVDLIAGTSGGALIGTLLALGHSPEEAEKLTTQLWTRETMTEFSRRSLLHITFPRQAGFPIDFSLMKDNKMMHNLRQAFGNKTFQDCKIPLYMAAARVSDGHAVILHNGDLVNAIRASIGIPLIFGPHKVNGEWLIDGGVADPLPIDVAIREGIDLILAMGFESPFNPEITSIIDDIYQTINIMTNNLTRSAFAFHNIAHHAEIIPMLMKFDIPIGLFDTHLIPYMIEQGEQITQKQLPYIKRLLEQ